jgi:hypothetical protein
MQPSTTVLLGLRVTLDKGPRSTKIGYQFGRFAMKQQNWVPVWKICNEIAYCFMKLGISSEKLAAKLGIVS